MRTAGKHGFDGKCAPVGANRYAGQKTFSVGIFQWLTKSKGTGLKRSKAKVRVSGSTFTPELVYAKAREIVDQLDNGTYAGPKSVRVNK